MAEQLPDYAYTTIATVLDRLSRKGKVRRTVEGRVHLYRATGTAGPTRPRQCAKPSTPPTTQTRR